MKIVIAPNAFKGTLTASQAASAIARGVREAMPDAEVVEVPVADGGDGTVEALVEARHGEYRTVRVEGPLGDPVDARYGLIDGGRAAVVELATASGLALIPEERRDPRRASTYGFGQLLEAARREGARDVIAGIGGSATNDGGTGMARALGYRFLSPSGHDVPDGGGGLEHLGSVDASGFDIGWRQIKVRVACDVTNPLTGPTGASFVYGPQKGADPQTVKALDGALEHLAKVVRRDLGLDAQDVAGAGAAGGTGYGMVAFLGAELVPGAPLVVEATGLAGHLTGAQLVITGEGRVDEQTGYGKAPGEVARRAREAGVPVIVIAGAKGEGWEILRELGVEDVITLEELAGRDEALNAPEGVLARAAVVACRRHSWTT